MITIVVDDIAFASNDYSLMRNFKLILSSTFKIKLFGTPTNFIGWQLHHTSKEIYVSQARFAEKLRNKHNLSHCKPAPKPFPLTINVSSRDPKELKLSSVDHRRFCTLVDSLTNFSVCTRLDIFFAVSVLSRQLHNPNYRHLYLAKRVVKYVSDTRT